MSIHKIKTVFIGTPDFGVPSLKALINDDKFEVLCVITQKDKKIGRKQILTASAIKQTALENKIPFFQPEKISQFLDSPFSKNLDLIVVVAYAKIIPKSILELPQFGCINVHGSLLPEYRGAACIQQAILDGKNETGITIMLMNEGLDTGPILSQHKVAIKKTDTAGTLFDALSKLGGEQIVPTLKKYIGGDIKAIAQDDTRASYIGLLKKEDGKIDCNQTAEFVERFIRAMSPWPGAFLEFKGMKIKILETKYTPIKDSDHKTGQLFHHEKKLFIKCGEDALEIERLQLEGKKISQAKDFICGHSDLIS